jgi:hypothetical protein
LSIHDCPFDNETSTCVSGEVLLAFTWINAMTLVIYFFTFLVAVLINKKRDSTIWHSMMRKFPWAGTCAILHSPPPTPTQPRFLNTSVPIIRAPKPRHARPIDKSDPIFSFASGLNREYEIEHYIPSATTHSVGGSHALSPPSAAAPPMLRPSVLPVSPTEPSATDGIPSFLYPLYVQQAANEGLEPSLPQPALTRGTPNTTFAIHQESASVAPASSPTPSPLGNWPRADILSQPLVRGKRKALPPIITESSQPTTVNDAPSPAVAEHSRPTAELPQPSTSRLSSQPVKHLSHTTTAPSSYAQPRLHPGGPRRRSDCSDFKSFASPRTPT